MPVAWINEETLKSRELSNPFKEKLYNSVCKMVCEENGFAYKSAPASGFVQYKAFIGKGNNSQCVRQLLKQRWWWQLHDKEEIDGMNFIWTMWRKNDILKLLPQHKGEEL